MWSFWTVATFTYLVWVLPIGIGTLASNFSIRNDIKKKGAVQVCVILNRIGMVLSWIALAPIIIGIPVGFIGYIISIIVAPKGF